MTKQPKGYFRHTLTNGEKSISVYQVSHISTADFYEKIMELLRHDQENGHVIHVEGLRGSDYQKKLHDSYRKTSRILGLEFQLDHINKEKIDYRNRDMDWDSLSPRSKKSAAIMNKSFDKILESLSREDEESRKMRDRMRNRILCHRKNPFLIDYLIRFLLGDIEKGRSYYAANHAVIESGSVSLVWGALHAHSIIKYLNHKGYRLVESVDIMEIEI